MRSRSATISAARCSLWIYRGSALASPSRPCPPRCCFTSRNRAASSSPSGGRTKNQRGVRAPEPERVRQHVAQAGRARFVRDEIQIALWVRLVEVERGREHLIAQGEDTEDGFD